MVLSAGTSLKTSQPKIDAHTNSRNLADWVAEMSADISDRVRQ
jgi:hypothetical protein